MLVYNHIRIHHSCLQQVAIVTTIEHLGYVEQCKEIWEGGGKEGRLRKGRGGGRRKEGEGEEGGKKGRKERKEEGRGGRRREERGSHKFNKVSCLHCLQQLLWPRGEVGDDCTQVVMAIAEPHTLTLNRTRSATLLGGAREEEEEEEGGREEGERKRRRRERRRGKGGGGGGRERGYEGVCVTGYWCKKEK